MGFAIFPLLLSIVMVANGLAILSETRFLPLLGLAPKPNFGTASPAVGQTLAFGNISEPSPPASEANMKISAFLQSVRMLLRWPLMIINWIFIIIIIISY